MWCECPLRGHTRPAAGEVVNDSSGSTAAVRERPGKPRLLAPQRRDSGRHPSGSHQGWSGDTTAQPVHASSEMSNSEQFRVVTPATGAVRPGPAVTASSRRVRQTVLRARRAATGSKIPIFGAGCGGPFRSSSFAGRVRFRPGMLEYRANVISAASRPPPCMEGKRQLLESLFGRRARCREAAFASASSIQTGA